MSGSSAVGSARGLGESRQWRVARPETDLKLCFK